MHHPQSPAEAMLLKVPACRSLGDLMFMEWLRAGGTIVQVSSSLGSLQRLSPEYRSRVTEAPDLQTLGSMPFNPSDRGMRNQMVPTCMPHLVLNLLSWSRCPQDRGP